MRGAVRVGGGVPGRAGGREQGKAEGCLGASFSVGAANEAVLAGGKQERGEGKWAT